MISVSQEPAHLEADLGGGRLRCPGCGGRLAAWGWARSRRIRTPTGQVAVRPRRGRCADCRRTHVLLADWLLLRRVDSADVIGQAVAAAAAGAGHRRIAAELGLPPTTVRDWLRSWRRRAPQVGAQFDAAGTGRGSAPGQGPGLSGRSRRRAEVAALAALRAAAHRHGITEPALAWRFAVVATAGGLLSNTSPP